MLFYVDGDVDDDYGDGCLATVARGPRLHTLPEQADPAGFLLDTHPHDVDAGNVGIDMIMKKVALFI